MTLIISRKIKKTFKTLKLHNLVNQKFCSCKSFIAFAYKAIFAFLEEESTTLRLFADFQICIF